MIIKGNDDWPAGQCSRYQVLTSGTSRARRIRPDRKLNGRGAHIRPIPFAVLSSSYKPVEKRKDRFKEERNNVKKTGRKMKPVCSAQELSTDYF